MLPSQAVLLEPVNGVLPWQTSIPSDTGTRRAPFLVFHKNGNKGQLADLEGESPTLDLKRVSSRRLLDCAPGGSMAP